MVMDFSVLIKEDIENVGILEYYYNIIDLRLKVK